MGENLFLSAYRFNQSLVKVYRATVPYVLTLALTVLAITYIQIMTLGLVRWLRQ